MKQRVAAYIQAHALIQEGFCVVVGVSGGADSVALLSLLCDLGPEMGFTVAAAHLNHGIRGASADADERFVRALCEKSTVPLHCERIDVPALARERGETVELAARVERYAFLERARERFGAERIAVAHHMDDQAESVLLHLTRGSGLLGLTGMKPRRGRIIRPLLCIRRSEIEAYLSSLGTTFCTDETNLLAEGTRNRLRLDVLPYIEKNINPAVVRALCSTAELLAQDEEYLAGQARAALDEAKCGDGYLREKLLALPAPILSRALRLALSDVGAVTDVERVHIDGVTALLSGRTGAMLMLPGANVWVNYDAVCFGRRTQASGESFRIPLVFPGETQVPGGRFIARISGDKSLPGDNFTACFDLDRLPRELVARRRLPGDRFHPLGAPGMRKLKEVFIDRKIPRQRRELPLIEGGGEILFAPGLGISNGAGITDSTARVLRVEFILSEAKQDGKNDQ